MVWKQIEATPPHLTYLILTSFLISYTLFARFIRNRLHLSEPPLALLAGIILGPAALGWLNPNSCAPQGCTDKVHDELGGWDWGDNILQEVTRVILGIQVFTIGVELPKFYASRHWKSVGILLGKSEIIVDSPKTCQKALSMHCATEERSHVQYISLNDRRSQLPQRFKNTGRV